MSIIQAMARARLEQREMRDGGRGDNSEGASEDAQGGRESPVKTLLAAMGKSKHKSSMSEGSTIRKEPRHDKLRPLPPKSIEDVPFRRQDRRILNSRKKRVMDRKLIRCQLVFGVLMILVGAALIALWWQMEQGEWQ